jgi:hypothetical protein
LKKTHHRKKRAEGVAQGICHKTKQKNPIRKPKDSLQKNSSNKTQNQTKPPKHCIRVTKVTRVGNNLHQPDYLLLPDLEWSPSYSG